MASNLPTEKQTAVIAALAEGWTVQPGNNGEAFEHVTVFGTPPIDSPIAAVRAWIVSQVRK